MLLTSYEAVPDPLKMSLNGMFRTKLSYLCPQDSNMEIFHKTPEIRNFLEGYRGERKTVGLVPTMGALHSGHLSLIKACNADNDVTVVTIFINPTQFNDPNDFKEYPRNFDQDIIVLRNQKCDAVFAPSNEEIYPEPDTRVFKFGNLEKEMEGKYRPGHFNGVAQVVSKLFEIIEPDNAYFGQKDFQQLIIIKELVRQLGIRVKIISCPIIREPDGLAMSSRNQLLDKKQRIAAAKINKTLRKAVTLGGHMEIMHLKKLVVGEVDSDPLLKTEYFEIVDEETLEPVAGWSGKKGKVGCIAVRIGTVRLIDNMKFS